MERDIDLQELSRRNKYVSSIMLTVECEEEEEEDSKQSFWLEFKNHSIDLLKKSFIAVISIIVESAVRK